MPVFVDRLDVVDPPPAEPAGGAVPPAPPIAPAAAPGPREVVAALRHAARREHRVRAD